MKARFLTLLFLSALGVASHAQEVDDLPEPFQQTFSLEFSAGLAPIHTIVHSNNLYWDEDFARQGLRPRTDGAWTPGLSLSAVWHTSLRWEFTLTAGFSWCIHRMDRFESFGMDPQGNPRYDLTRPIPDGWRQSIPAFAFFGQVRRLWNPTRKVKFYSAFGFGLTTDGEMIGSEFAPVPSITPIAVRFGTGHLTWFIENTYSPAATLAQAGLGWTF